MFPFLPSPTARPGTRSARRPRGGEREEGSERSGVLALALAALSAIGVGALGAACTERPEGYRDEPEVPANLASLNEDVVLRIEDAVDRVRGAPASAETWGALGMTYEAVGLREHAVTCYEQARMRDPKEPRWWYRSGVCLGRMDDVAMAADHMDRALALAPDYAPAHYRKGSFHLDMGDLDEAFAEFERAAEIDPEYAGGWVGQARVLLQRDAADEAVRLLAPLERRDPTDGVLAKLSQNAHRQAGLAWKPPFVGGADAASVAEGGARDGEEEGGALWTDPWQEELRQYRQLPEAHRLSKMLNAGGRADAVIKKLERRRKEEPDAIDFLPQLAEAYYQAGRVQEARATYRDLLAAQPDNIPARMGLARFHELEGTIHLALPWLDEVIERDPTFGPAYEAQGRIFLAGDQFQRAIYSVTKALQYDQRNPDLWLWRGQAYVSTGEWNEAIADLENYLERQKGDGVGWYFLAKARMKIGAFDDADAALARARASGSVEAAAVDALANSIRASRKRAERREREGDEEEG